jgi:hypothetical protein
VRSGFEPRLRLEVPAGWARVQDGESFFALYRPLVETGAGGLISDVAVLVARLEGDDAPGDVIDGLESNPALQVSGVGAAELDGAEGLRADVEATAATLISFPGGSRAAFPGRRLRVYAVDVDGRTVVFAVEAASESFEEHFEAAEPVLDGVAFG